MTNRFMTDILKAPYHQRVTDVDRALINIKTFDEKAVNLLNSDKIPGRLDSNKSLADTLGERDLSSGPCGRTAMANVGY